MTLHKIPLLLQIVIAILLGIGFGTIFPDWLTRGVLTFNGIFSNFLGFIIPLLILSLIAPGIADLGKGAGRLLLITALLAYVFTVFAGVFTYACCSSIFPLLIDSSGSLALAQGSASALIPYFVIEMPPIMGVMTALILAFTLGLGMTLIPGSSLKAGMNDLRDIITIVIERAIIPLLPIYIFGVFLQLTAAGEVASVLGMFIKIILVIFALTLILLLIQFSLAGLIAKRNPLRMLRTMLPAYLTALGTQSSAATIPVTLKQTIKNGVEPSLASFIIPLCATIHLSGSTLKIVACAMAVMMSSGSAMEISQMLPFILMLGITMIAAPGVPGGAIMAATAVLQSMLGFDDSATALMIALYIAMDSFGTACNVTGDGSIAVIINKLYKA